MYMYIVQGILPVACCLLARHFRPALVMPTQPSKLKCKVRREAGKP